MCYCADQKVYVLGQILVWDLEKKAEPIEEPKDLLSHMRGISSSHFPVTTFTNPSWDSPVNDADWMSENRCKSKWMANVLFF
jgi:hypothetical protein